ncbi:MAG: dUTP diphosphatase [Oscillospiraceae bacterium]|nr:dUTP diphosphatase [Oscillospiraceae bacterium]MDD4368107.1 dUTP diphosphatase [Oscillospiraceae bacterium]
MTEHNKDQTSAPAGQPTPCLVTVEKIRATARLPFYAHEGDAGMDICAAEDVELAPGETVAVPTGLKFLLPRGMEIQVRPRSGLSLKTPLRLPNSPGTIDSGYRDELKILLHNSSCPCQVQDEAAVYTLEEKANRKGRYLIKCGDRIAQLVFAQVTSINLQVKALATQAAETSAAYAADRGGGFGHSGVSQT